MHGLLVHGRSKTSSSQSVDYVPAVQFVAAPRPRVDFMCVEGRRKGGSGRQEDERREARAPVYTNTTRTAGTRLSYSKYEVKPIRSLLLVHTLPVAAGAHAVVSGLDRAWLLHS